MKNRSLSQWWMCVVDGFIWGGYHTSVHVLIVCTMHECRGTGPWCWSHGRLCQGCSGEGRCTLSLWHW